jgi:carboxypeptidase T
VLVATPPGFDDLVWHHLAIVKDASGSRLYFDGTLFKSATTGAAAVSTNGLFRLGTNENGAYGIAATFDELRVYGRALTATEVAGLLSTPAAGQLQVQVAPAAVAALGARWRIAGGAWHASGDSVSLPSGVYQVEAEEMEGWQPPAPRTVTVSPGATTSLTLSHVSLVATPILRLGFEETAGSAATDLSGHGRHGSYGTRVARGLGGVAGRAAEMAGVGASLGSLADGVQIPGLTGGSYREASVALWYRLPSEPHDGYLFGWGGTHSAADSVSLFLDAGVGLRLRVHGGADSSSMVQLAPAGFENAAWHHLAVVKEETGSRLYFDGAEVYAGAMGGGTFAPKLGFFLGTNQVGSFGVEAAFDELQVFDRALTPGQVHELYGGGAPEPAFGGAYLTVAEIEAALEAAAAARPDLVELVNYGDSYAKTQGGILSPGGDPLAGHDLLAAKVGRGGGAKPVLVLTGCLHPREIATSELVLRFLGWLVAGDGVDPDATWLLEHHQIYLLPLTNPDGHDLVELGSLEKYGARPFRWRKNARPIAGCPWPPTDAGAGSGVDLNRNFAFAWGTSNDRAGSSTPCDPYYRGPSAASEPETRALADLVRSLIADQRGPGTEDAAPEDATGIFVQLHSPYRTVGWPWSQNGNPAPNAADLAEIGKQLAGFAGYQSGQVGSALYEMTGAAESWVYGELGAAAFLVEVGEGLMPAYGRVGNVLWPEVRGALVHAAKIARAPYQLSRGPLVSLAAAATNAGGVTITARAEEKQGEPVAAAEAYFDLQPWDPEALAWPLEAADGAFGGNAENLAGNPAPGLTAGRHLVYIRARDAAGNWGPVSAAFLEIP